MCESLKFDKTLFMKKKPEKKSLSISAQNLMHLEEFASNFTASCITIGQTRRNLLGAESKFQLPKVCQPEKIDSAVSLKGRGKDRSMC